MNGSQKLAQAADHQRAGRLAQAEKLYQQILVATPNHAPALHGLATLASQTGQHALAADYFKKLAALNPQSHTAQNNLGVALSALGQMDQAMAAYQQAIQIEPHYAPVFYNLGIALAATGRADQAIAAFQRAIELRPQHAASYHNLAQALLSQGKTSEAVTVLRRAAELQPTYQAYCHLAEVLLADQKPQQAAEAYRHAIVLRPDDLGARRNLAALLVQAGNFHETIGALRQITDSQPNNAEAHYNLAAACLFDGQYEQAIASYQTAIVLRPDYADAYKDLSTALAETGHFDAALAANASALRIRPDWPQAHTELSCSLLRMGEYQKAWPEHEWRLRIEGDACPRNYSQPMWNGEFLDNKKILLHPEQRFGDILLFLRFVPLVAQHGGRCILGPVPRELLRLLQNMPDVETVVEHGKPAPQFDIYCPLSSLPCIFNISRQTLPAKVPYLHVDAALVQTWQQRLGPRLAKRMRVGLVWSGKLFPPGRSVPWQELAPLAGIPNVEFHSLQVGQASSEPLAIPNGIQPIDWSSHITDFAESAALMSVLDLVITIDSAPANLAGALGRPTWVLLRVGSDWRWTHDGPFTPWFPTARLFRQKISKQWHDVVQQVASELRKAAIEFQQA